MVLSDRKEARVVVARRNHAQLSNWHLVVLRQHIRLRRRCGDDEVAVGHQLPLVVDAVLEVVALLELEFSSVIVRLHLPLLPQSERVRRMDVRNA